ncbi:MAG: cytochrome P450 [Ktedonobacteraceae bacterium]
MSESQGLRYDQLNPTYRKMREASPVHYHEQYRAWQVFRYQDVQQVTLNPTTFSSHVELAGGLIGASLIAMDPPVHRRMRALASQAFTPRRVKQWEARIVVLVQSLLDAVVDRGQMDVITDLGYPLPAIVIAQLLGIPSEDCDQFKHWSDAIVAAVAQPHGEQSGSAQIALTNYLHKELERHRKASGNDIMSDLLVAEIDGEKLSDDDIVVTCALLLIGGHETTTNLIGNAFLCFMEHPEALEEIRADPTLIPSAIEEILRYWSPVACNFRLVKTDTSLSGMALKAGEYVQVFFSSANRDESVFPDADCFDIRRSPNRHLGFGHGIHFCLGAPLARLEGTIALRMMLERFSSIQLFPDTLFEPAWGVTMQGVKHLPITFAPVK